jgi:hypothetical protein
MPVRGMYILRSEDTLTSGIDPAALAVAEQMLIERGVPKRAKGFSPSQLAQDVGGSTRSWQRKCEDGDIEAADLCGWSVTWPALVRYVAAKQNMIDGN